MWLRFAGKWDDGDSLIVLGPRQLAGDDREDFAGLTLVANPVPLAISINVRALRQHGNLISGVDYATATVLVMPQLIEIHQFDDFRLGVYASHVPSPWAV